MSVFDRLLDAMRMSGGLDDEEDFYDTEEEYDDDEVDEFLDDEEEEAPRKSILERFAMPKKEQRASRDRDTQEYDGMEEEEEQAEQDPEPAPAPKRQGRTSRQASRSESRERSRDGERFRSSSKITPMRSGKRQSGSTMEVCVIRPNSMENTEEIADTLLENATVILNLEGIDVELAQRIFDFTSGCCYSLGGTLTKVSSYIFILGPSNVDVTGDLENIMGGNMSAVGSGF